MSERAEDTYIRDIAVDNREDREEAVRDALLKVELFYLDHLVRNGKADGKKFSDLLAETDSNLRNDLFKLSDLEFGTKDASHAVEYFSLIENAHAGGESPEAATEAAFWAIRALYERWERGYPEEWAKRRERSARFAREKAGLLIYNPADVSFFEENEVMALERAGYDPEGDFLEIHLPDQYASDSKLTVSAIKESLAKVAEVVVDRFPQSQAVIGKSWLLDRPVIRNMLGMEALGEGRPNWRQFLTEDGQINRDRLAEMAEKGELPFKNVFAAVSAEDFLRKFLPPERRGEVTLKQTDPTWREKYGGLKKATQAEGSAFVEAWDSGAIKSESDIRAFLAKLPKFLSVLERSGTFEEYVSLLAANIGKKRKDIYSGNEEKLDALNRRLEAYYSSLEKDKYTERKVLIE